MTALVSAVTVLVTAVVGGRAAARATSCYVDSERRSKPLPAGRASGETHLLTRASFSSTRALTMRFTSAAGSGFFAENRIVRPETSKSCSSSRKAFITSRLTTVNDRCFGCAAK